MRVAPRPTRYPLPYALPPDLSVARHPTRCRPPYALLPALRVAAHPTRPFAPYKLLRAGPLNCAHVFLSGRAGEHAPGARDTHHPRPVRPAARQRIALRAPARRPSVQLSCPVRPARYDLSLSCMHSADGSYGARVDRCAGERPGDNDVRSIPGPKQKLFEVYMQAVPPYYVQVSQPLRMPRLVAAARVPDTCDVGSASSLVPQGGPAPMRLRWPLWPGRRPCVRRRHRGPRRGRLPAPPQGRGTLAQHTAPAASARAILTGREKADVSRAAHPTAASVAGAGRSGGPDAHCDRERRDANVRCAEGAVHTACALTDG